MEEVKEIFDAIRDTPRKSEKERIVSENKDNKQFSSALNFLLNPYVATGISDKKIKKNVGVKSLDTVGDSFDDVLGYLKLHNTGTDNDIAFVQQFLANQSKRMREFYLQLLTKSYRLGCAENTVNKAFGYEFIPKFECMLANKYFDNPNVVNGKEFTLTTKLDGIRCLAISDNNRVSLFSRQGQRLCGLSDIEADIAELGKGFVLDGELLIKDRKRYPSKEQYKLTTKIVRADGEKQGIDYNVFDYISLNSYKYQKASRPYFQRRRDLEDIENQHSLKNVKVLPALYIGTDTSKILDCLNFARSDGEEGVMININDAPYEFKRTNNLLKCKVMSDCDLEIIGIEEGRGRLSATAGTIVVSYKGGTLGVGSGLSDTERKWFWEHKDELIGRVITVQYFEETVDCNGNQSLRFPVFKELREYGKEPNI
ncbi:MAG: hypothetical protein RR365_10840 [Bacteroides sp.]